MVKRNEKETCCVSLGCCCRIESLVSVDERGQMVLSKELRNKANIKSGDKLAVATWEKDGKIYCITLMKADEVAGIVKGMLEPMMQEVIKK